MKKQKKEKAIKCIICQKEWLACKPFEIKEIFVCPICKRKVAQAVENIPEKYQKNLVTNLINKIL